MKIKALFLTLLLITGFTFQNCNSDDFCSCPDFLGGYFDIEGMEVVHVYGNGACCDDVLSPNQSLSFEEYYGPVVDYSINYYGQNTRQSRWSFSLINTAYACSCRPSGDKGSMEKLSKINVITLNDFDSLHLANDTINDLLQIRNLPADILMGLEEYVQQDTSFIGWDFLEMKLLKAPEINEEFRVKVFLELESGENYEKESYPVRITQ